MNRKRHGFTLTELLIAITILSLVLAGAYSTFYSFSKSIKASLNHLDQSMELQYAFESMHKSIRGISQVHQTTANTFEFTTTKLDGSTERIQYRYDPNKDLFYRKSITNGTERELLKGVSGAKFTYYDRFGKETGTQIDINAAKLEVTSEREGIGGDLSVDTETALITFRNRTL